MPAGSTLAMVADQDAHVQWAPEPSRALQACHLLWQSQVSHAGCPCPCSLPAAGFPVDSSTTGTQSNAAQAILQWRRQASTSAAHHAVHTHHSALGAGRSQQCGGCIPGHAGHGATVCLNLTQHIASRGGGVDHTQCASGLGRRQGQEGRIGGGAQRTAALQSSHASAQTATPFQMPAGMRPGTQPHGTIDAQPMRMLLWT